MPITSKGSRPRARVSGPCVCSSLVFLCALLILVQSTTVLGALELQLDEEQPAGTIVGDISAGLPPGEIGGLYFISDHESTGVSNDLDIDETTGIITTARRLDREERDHYSFIAVTMTGVTIEVSIAVNDINDHAPAFPKKKAVLKIPEHTAVGTRFSLEPAADADKDQLTTRGYAIREGNIGQAFRLETKRAANKVLYLDLVVNGLLDREKRSLYTMVLEAFDGGSPRRMGSMTLEVIVTDINDHAPVFNQTRYHAIISESLPQGSRILQVSLKSRQCSDSESIHQEQFFCLHIHMVQGPFNFKDFPYLFRCLQSMRMRAIMVRFFMKSTAVRVTPIAASSWTSSPGS